MGKPTCENKSSNCGRPVDPAAELFTASMVDEIASKLDFLSPELALIEAAGLEGAVVDKLEDDAEPTRDNFISGVERDLKKWYRHKYVLIIKYFSTPTLIISIIT